MPRSRPQNPHPIAHRARPKSKRSRSVKTTKRRRTPVPPKPPRESQRPKPSLNDFASRFGLQPEILTERHVVDGDEHEFKRYRIGIIPLLMIGGMLALALRSWGVL